MSWSSSKASGETAGITDRRRIFSAVIRVAAPQPALTGEPHANPSPALPGRLHRALAALSAPSWHCSLSLHPPLRPWPMRRAPSRKLPPKKSRCPSKARTPWASKSPPGFPLPAGTLQYERFGTTIRGYLQLASDPQLTWTTSAPNTVTAGCVISVSAPPVTSSTPAGLSYEYQWYSFSYPWTASAIPGATGPTYTVRAEDSAKTLYALVKPVAPGYDSTQAGRRSLWSPTVQGVHAPAAPIIKGTALAGQLLTAVPAQPPPRQRTACSTSDTGTGSA